MATQRPTSQPARVDLDLDTYEYERPEPFVFNWHERVISVKDAGELDVFTLARLDSGDPAAFFAACLEREDQNHIAEHPMNGKQFNGLVKAYKRHIGTGENGPFAG